MTTSPGARRASARHRTDSQRRQAPPKNPFLIGSLLVMILLAGVCLVVWVLPAGEPVAAGRRTAAQNERNDLEVQVAALRVSAAANDKDMAARQAQLAALQEKLTPAAGVAPEEILALQNRIDALERELAPQRATIAKLRQVRQDEEGDLKLSPDVLKAVNANLLKVVDRGGAFVCGTYLRGWYFTTVPQVQPAMIAYGAGRNLEIVQVTNTLRHRSPYLLVQRYDRADPQDPAFDLAGFTPQDYETKPKEGQTVYCVCHQMVDGTPLNNTVVSGVYAGTKTINGQVFIKTTLPARREMSGAPVVTAQGKIIGILMPQMAGVEDLSLVLPVDEMNRAATGQ